MKRRTFLRGLFAGAAVSVALPPLEIMLNSTGTALADGEDLPTRFGLWFWGNGIRPEVWVPSGTGSSWTPSDPLSPLVEVKPWVSVVTGLAVKTGTYPHHSGITGVLTGTDYHKLRNVRDTIASTFAGPSVDQVVAEAMGSPAPYRSLEVGVTRFRGTDEGSTFTHVSHNGPNDPNPAEYSPRTLYARLFGGPTDARVDLVRQSVLDSVGEQVQGLERKLGSADRARLDRHLTSIRELEGRLDLEDPSCLPGDAPDVPYEEPGREPIEEKNEVMSELLALALACDLTRTFSVQFSSAGAGVVWWQIGASNSHHYTCHTEPMPQPIIQAATKMTMAQFASFCRILRDTEEGDGNVLDRSSILATSDLCDGRRHTLDEYPLLIAGKGGGRLKGGMHVREVGGNVSDAVLTAIRGAGVELPEWGTGAGRTTRTISDLLA